jgi:hypothetical protein
MQACLRLCATTEPPRVPSGGDSGSLIFFGVLAELRGPAYFNTRMRPAHAGSTFSTAPSTDRARQVTSGTRLVDGRKENRHLSLSIGSTSQCAGSYDQLQTQVTCIFWQAQRTPWVPPKVTRFFRYRAFFRHVRVALTDQVGGVVSISSPRISS